MLKTIETILEDLAKITPQEIARANSIMNDPEDGDEALSVMPQHVQELWTLQFLYAHKGKLAALSAQYDFDDMDSKKRLLGEANKWSGFHDIALELAWIEARDFVGDPGWALETITMRKGFVLCKSKPDKEEPNPAYVGSLGSLGPFPLSPRAMEVIRHFASRMMGDREDEEDKPKEKKPPQ